MRPPTAIIAEDEPVLRRELADALRHLWPELEVVAQADNGLQAVDALETFRPDVAFLDIEMPGMSGIEVARLASGRCHVLFVTAYDQHAIAAFEAGAIDYLLKPFTPARLAAAVARVRARIHHTAPDSEALPRSTGEGDHANRGPLRWITVAQGRVVRFISVDDVCYFKADNKYTKVVTATAQSLISRTIKELLTELDQDVFLQIHRSTIVNVHRIAAIHRDLRGRLEVQLKDRRETLQVSASFAHVFKRM